MDNKILKWNFIFQYGWVITNIINSILLLPFYLKYIHSDTLGIWLATGSILSWMLLVDPGVGEVLQQKIAELRGRNENSEVCKAIGSGFVASGAILVLSIGIGLICYGLSGTIINKDIHSYEYLPSALMVSVVAAALSLLSFSLTGINQGLHNSAHVAISSLSANFLFLFSNLALLFAGFGVLSIALANLIRSVYINLFNIISLLRYLKKQGLVVIYEKAHFARFIRIFSVTSLSKIISGLSYSVDMIVLARYLPVPAMITTYEVNKRPINVLWSLVGRHSVALMPLISHSKGKGDKDAIMALVNRHFRIYAYASIFLSLGFLFNHENLITLWTGPGKFAGNTILVLMVLGFFFSLICYFMSIVGYALGDIKMNSVYGIVRNICYGGFMFFAAKYYGIIGTLVVNLCITVLADYFFFNYRMHKLGYFDKGLLFTSLKAWAFLIPGGLLFGWLSHKVFEQVLPATSYLLKLLANGSLFTAVFLMMVLLIDKDMRFLFKKNTNRFVVAPLHKLLRA